MGITPILQFASYLKSVYTREKLPIYDKWPQVKSKKYINLALIEREDITKRESDQFKSCTIHGNIDNIKKSKRAIDIGQIAQMPDGSQPKCILVEGAPGVGKSTCGWKLCRKWGKGKLLQQYQLLVLLRLRDKSVRAATNISNLFQYHDHQIQQTAVEEIQRTGGKGVLLLFEGYDELPEELRTGSSVFLDVITGRELPEVTVLITSRPWASEFLHLKCKRNISQHIEILGFTKADIQSYLESTIPNDPSLLTDLKKYISCYPHIGSMMYIPLNSAIVVEVYRNSKKDETLVPKTMTELYSSLVRSLLLRHLFDHPVHGKKRWRVHGFSDLPQDVYQQLCELASIAYKGILHDQQVIFSDLPEEFETLGLMQCAPELYADEGATVSYNFLHLTVQEYLAAFHLSQQPVVEQIKHFKRCKTVVNMPEEVKRQLYQRGQYQKQWDDHFHMVMRFLSGVRKFSGYPNDVLDTLCVERLVSCPPKVESFINFNALHWLFETQDSKVIARVLGSFDMQLDQGGIWTSFDCFVLGYCVSHSNCNWNIGFGNICYNIGDEGLELFMRGATQEETHCTGGISEIILRQCDITSEGVKLLLKIPKRLINKLEMLILSKLDSRSCAVFADLVPHLPHLKVLNLSGNPNIAQGGAVPLMTSLTAHKSLEELRLDKTGIGVEDCQALGELLSSTSLKKLSIGENALPSQAVELIISGLHHNTTLKWLNMSGSHFSLQNTISLASVLSTNHTLVDFSLVQCSIDSDGAGHIASALYTNDTLHKLDLWDNPIGVKGATAFAEMLRINHTLVYLSLRQCNIDSDRACQLANALCTNDTLQMLNLSDHPIGVIGAFGFAEMLMTNYTLVYLSLGQCKIDSDGACQLANALCINDTLQVMDMRDNPIGAKGATAFAEMLRTNHTLVYLSLRQCNIDSDGACQLASALCTNDTLQELNLSGQPIGAEGATAFAEMVRTNHTLVGLHLRQCNIDSNGTCHLASALFTNGTLQDLDLGHNPIGAEGAIAFAKLLLTNKSLQKLNIDDVSIGEEGTQKLIDTLKHNTTVEMLVIPIKYASSHATSRVDTRVIPPLPPLLPLLPPPSRQQVRP